MADPQDVSARLARLERELSGVVRRLDALEAARPAVATEAGPSLEAVAVTPESVASDVDLSQWAALLGRSVVVFGGAYLLRALTEGGYLPMMAGAGLGLLYAG